MVQIFRPSRCWKVNYPMSCGVGLILTSSNALWDFIRWNRMTNGTRLYLVLGRFRVGCQRTEVVSREQTVKNNWNFYRTDTVKNPGCPLGFGPSPSVRSGTYSRRRTKRVVRDLERLNDTGVHVPPFRQKRKLYVWGEGRVGSEDCDLHILVDEKRYVCEFYRHWSSVSLRPWDTTISKKGRESRYTGSRVHRSFWSLMSRHLLVSKLGTTVHNPGPMTQECPI